MRTLAFETSCDDTSLALVHFDGSCFCVEKMVAFSQIATHQEYGGVVPELASRLHERHIIDLLHSFGDLTTLGIDCVSVTQTPGLPGSLSVGITAAHYVSEFLAVPLIPVNHIHGHLFSFLLDVDFSSFTFPQIVLTASGGHNELYFLTHKNKKIGFSSFEVMKLGSTGDDAAGECFDKVARMLGGPYPGGAWIAQQALLATDSHDFKIKKINVDPKSYEFSFSGIKSQVHHLLQSLDKQHISLDTSVVVDIASCAQDAIVQSLIDKIIQGVDEYHPQSISICGGVSANQCLYESLKQSLIDRNYDISITRPVKLVYCTDNAGMIGLVGLLHYLDTV